MVRVSRSRLSEGRVTLQLLEALGSSLDVREMLKAVYPLLNRLAPADCGALGVSHSAQPEGFEWIVADLPPAFFAAYPEMAAHDFVRRSVASRPNVVLRDEDMVSRPELEQNMMYRRAREVGAPIEQVVAVMLHVDDRWQSGLSLYREQRRPFSTAERARLQRVTPALVNAVRNCHLFGQSADWKSALERLMESSSAAIMLATPSGTEVARTEQATQLLERWFNRYERRGARLPSALATALAVAEKCTAGSTIWRTHAPGVTLEVSVLPLTGYFGDARWMLRLQELSDAPSLPDEWRTRLTKREQQVTCGVLQGEDNRGIGEELGCTEGTVKKHLQNIFQKLGVESRAALAARAARGLRHQQPGIFGSQQTKSATARETGTRAAGQAW